MIKSEEWFTLHKYLNNIFMFIRVIHDTNKGVTEWMSFVR